MTKPQLTIDQLVEAFVALRDQKKEMEERHKEELAPTVRRMDMALKLIEQIMNEQGVESVRTRFGTPYKTVLSRVKITDWEAARNFVDENNLGHWYTRSLSKEGVETYLEEYGELPPGVDITRITNINVKRS